MLFQKIMRIRVVILFILLLFLPHFIFSQERENDPKEKISKWPCVEIGTGILHFNGDVGKGDGLTSLSKISFGSHITIEERFGNYFGVSINSIYGKLDASDRSLDLNRNFQSKISQTNVNLIFHFDNGIMMKRFAAMAPFISVGIGYLKFDPYGDLKDQNGNPYHYWSDGGIFNVAESSPNSSNAIMVKRDYTYETRLADSSVNYSRHTFAIPVTAGVKFKVSSCLHINLSASYYYTFSDYIDNVKARGNNDGYFYLAVGAAYNFGARKKEKDDPSLKVDFASIDNSDSDGDGIKDIDDACQGTPAGVTIDQHGCPLDTDEDGIPDYLDKEPNTKKGVLADENGVTLTDEKIAEKYWESKLLGWEKSEEKIEYISGVLPDQFKYADTNNDGHISVTEINVVIFNFFEAGSKIKQEDIKNLIEYYFSAE